MRQPQTPGARSPSSAARETTALKSPPWRRGGGPSRQQLEKAGLKEGRPETTTDKMNEWMNEFQKKKRGKTTQSLRNIKLPVTSGKEEFFISQQNQQTHTLSNSLRSRDAEAPMVQGWSTCRRKAGDRTGSPASRAFILNPGRSCTVLQGHDGKRERRKTFLAAGNRTGWGDGIIGRCSQ